MRTSSALGQPVEDELSDLGEPPSAVGAAEVQDRTGDASHLVPSEAPVQQRGQIGVVEGGRVALRLNGGARRLLLDHAAPPRPDHLREELVERGFQAAFTSRLDQPVVGGAELVGGRCVHVRRFDQREAVDASGRVCSQLQSDGPAVRQADDVRAVDAQRVEQSGAVSGIANDRAGSLGRAAARVPAAVVEDLAVAVLEHRLVGERPQLIRLRAVCTRTTGSPDPQSNTSSSAPGTGTERADTLTCTVPAGWTPLRANARAHGHRGDDRRWPARGRSGGPRHPRRPGGPP